MNKLIALLALLLVAATLLLGNQLGDLINDQLAPASAPIGTYEREPYGGCDEAWQAPKSEGYAWCEEHGLLP